MTQQRPLSLTWGGSPVCAPGDCWVTADGPLGGVRSSQDLRALSPDLETAEGQATETVRLAGPRRDRTTGPHLLQD